MNSAGPSPNDSTVTVRRKAGEAAGWTGFGAEVAGVTVGRTLIGAATGRDTLPQGVARAGVEFVFHVFGRGR
ncbi:hypothetical protein [Streptomyces sp. NPDC058157]|uniref:hypothetical protein n=1 Tax=Streptomyces sp. NPDC058157 TaxID=3346360 RepID=UPI0036EE4664